MKAKIKNTGEIIKIADYATITLDSCDSWGNPIEVKPEDIELIQEVSKNEHWQDVRERAAIAAMQSIISTSISKFHKVSFNDAAKYAISFADSLVRLLKNVEG